MTLSNALQVNSKLRTINGAISQCIDMYSLCSDDINIETRDSHPSLLAHQNPRQGSLQETKLLQSPDQAGEGRDQNPQQALPSDMESRSTCGCKFGLLSW